MPTIESNTPSDSTSGAVADAGTEDRESADEQHKASDRQKEIGGREGPEPTRYGDWEKAGRCIDF